jgi:hypothetical protein
MAGLLEAAGNVAPLSAAVARAKTKHNLKQGAGRMVVNRYPNTLPTLADFSDLANFSYYSILERAVGLHQSGQNFG